MRTIALVTLKGGAGKSTLASNIAVMARRDGERVFVADLDPLQSLIKWSQNRQMADLPVEHIRPAKLSVAQMELKRKGYSLLVVDGPGADSECLDGAIRAADLCIIPSRPNFLDLWASEVTRIRVKAKNKDHAFLLNQCPPAQQSARVAQGAKALQEMGALLAPLISSRVDYQEAVRLGLGVGELKPNSMAAQEMSALWESLKHRLEMSATIARPIPSNRIRADEGESRPAGAVRSEQRISPESTSRPAGQAGQAWPFWLGPNWPFWQI
jgi:chromosome partitioning protein